MNAEYHDNNCVRGGAASDREALARAHVLVVGAGGLGCPAAMALAKAGVGTFTVLDDDTVEVSNLHRQIAYRDEDAGRPKVDAFREALARIAPNVAVFTHHERLLPHNAVERMATCDVVVEGSDNFATKFLAADAALLAKKPIVHGSAVRWVGTALAVGPSGGPCYRCLFEDLPTGQVPNCAEAGVVGPVVGVIAAVQADLALSILLRDTNTFGTLATFDGKELRGRRRTVRRRASCLLCGDHATLRRDEIVVARYINESGEACE